MDVGVEKVGFPAPWNETTQMVWPEQKRSLGAGTSGRRKRDNLLDNVDPADPETSDARRPEEPDRKRSPAGDSSASTSANGWAADSQRKTEGPATEPGTSAWANGTFAADENGWAGPPKPEAEDWGWGTDRGRSGQSRKAKDSSRGVWPDSNGADNDNASGDATPAADAAQGDAWEEGPWDEDDGPDIVELRPEEVVRMHVAFLYRSEACQAERNSQHIPLQ